MMQEVWFCVIPRVLTACLIYFGRKVSEIMCKSTFLTSWRYFFITSLCLLCSLFMINTLFWTQILSFSLFLDCAFVRGRSNSKVAIVFKVFRNIHSYKGMGEKFCWIFYWSIGWNERDDLQWSIGIVSYCHLILSLSWVI